MRRIGIPTIVLALAMATGACRDKVPLGSWGAGISTGAEDPEPQQTDDTPPVPDGPVESDVEPAPSSESPTDPVVDTDVIVDASAGTDVEIDAMTPEVVVDGGADGGVDAGDLLALPMCNAVGNPGPLNLPGLGGFGATQVFTDWVRSEPSTSLAWELMIEESVPERGETEAPSSGYYWAHQFSFVEGVVGVFGLQAEGGYNSEPGPFFDEFTKIAVFWLSGPPLAAELGDIAPPDARVAPDTAGGLDWMTIHARFEWEECHVYRLSVAPESTEEDGSTWYGGWIDDLDTGETTLLGRMLLPADIGMISTFSTSRTWPIDFDVTTSACNVHQYASATFGAPVGDGVVSELAGSHFEQPARCGTSRTTRFDNAVRHEVGVRP